MQNQPICLRFLRRLDEAGYELDSARIMHCIGGDVSNVECRSCREEAMPFLGMPVNFGDSFFRGGDPRQLVNQVDPKIFIDDPNVSRVIVAVVYNHLDSDLLFINQNIKAGDFTPGFGPPTKIAHKSAGAYRLQSSDGDAVNVTVHYGLEPPGSSEVALSVTISAPNAAGHTSVKVGSSMFPVTDPTISPGNHCQADIDQNP